MFLGAYNGACPSSASSSLNLRRGFVGFQIFVSNRPRAVARSIVSSFLSFSLLLLSIFFWFLAFKYAGGLAGDREAKGEVEREARVRSASLNCFSPSRLVNSEKQHPDIEWGVNLSTIFFSAFVADNHRNK